MQTVLPYSFTLCYNLSAAGYEVDAALAKSAAECLCRKQEYDLIVLDINLLDGNGFDFCRDIKERHPDTAVIFLTANDMESDMLKGYELGAVASMMAICLSIFPISCLQT